MLTIDKDKNISITRGDVLLLAITCNNKNKTPYTFSAGDILRFKIIEKAKCNCVIVQKDVIVKESTTSVDIDLTSEETKIGGLINKPVDYWYEVELNPDTDCQTIIGYEKDKGAKLFTLLPEGGNKK